MLLNPLLSAHTPDLLSRIRTRGIVQYLSPFSSVRVSAMATAFGTDEDAMLAEVCALAERGDIPVKVDLVDRVLRIDERDPRAQAFRKAIEGGSATTALAIGSTFRMRLKEAGVIVGGEKRDRDRDVKAK
jgi:COP9 signalosome complex subunit 1